MNLDAENIYLDLCQYLGGQGIELTSEPDELLAEVARLIALSGQEVY